MVIRPAHQDFAPRLRMRRLELLTLGKPLDRFRCQRPQNKTCRIAQERVSEPVHPFEMLEQKNQFLDVIRR
jgi:hypothetical protein